MAAQPVQPRGPPSGPDGRYGHRLVGRTLRAFLHRLRVVRRRSARPPHEPRRHEVYHLRADPTEAERARGVINPGCPKLLSWRTRPASVVVERDLGFFPLRDAAGRELTAYDRAWLVPFADGWRAREVAAVAATCPPCYNFLELGGGRTASLGRGSGGRGGDRCTALAVVGRRRAETAGPM